MTKNDQVVIATIVTTIIKDTVPGIVKDIVEQNNHLLKRDIRDEIHATTKAMKREIVTEIAELLDGSVLPQITELQYDVARLKEQVGV